jgi:hypothetical protein
VPSRGASKRSTAGSNLAGEINSGDAGAIDGLRHLASHINDTIAKIDGMLGAVRDV